jgi:hypothetical protein
MPTPTALPRGFWQQGREFEPVALVVGATRAREGVRLRERFPGLSSLCRWMPGMRHGRGARRRKSGDGRGGWLLDWGSGFRLRSPVLKSRPVARDRRCVTGAVGSVACHFFVSSSGRPVGREREGISSQSTHRNPRAGTNGFRRNPGLVTCSSTILPGSSTKDGLPH